MIPDTTALLVLLGLVPGWVFWSLGARHHPRGSRSTLSEVLELVAVGVLTTGVALLVWVLVDGLRVQSLLSASGWATGGEPYLTRHIPQAAFTAFLVMVCASGAAFGLSKSVHRGPRIHDPGGVVWWNAIQDHAVGQQAYVGVMLDDGMLVEGLITGFTTDDTAGTGRDLALAAPIRVTPGGAATSVRQQVDRILIPERLTRWVTVRYVDVPRASGESRDARTLALARWFSRPREPH